MTTHTTHKTPSSHIELIAQTLQSAAIPALSRASIRELVSLVNRLEAVTGTRYVRLTSSPT